MSIEITLLISIIALASSVYFGLRGLKRNDAKDIQARAATDATINVKLDNITSAVNDIKYDISDTKTKVAEIDKKLVVVEQSVKSAHHRIDAIERGEENSHAEK